MALFAFDPAKSPQLSRALWVPLTWMFFMGSRQPSQWLTGNLARGGADVAQALAEGNPLNRTVSLILLVLAIGILSSRSFRLTALFAQNSVLTTYLIFALISVLWSDFPLSAFRKWSRDLGNYVMILVAISDRRPLEAASTLLRRLGYLLVPLSVVLIKYFPVIARVYDPWTGAVSYSGASTSKNMLGILCLVCGIYFFWDTVVRWPDRRNRQQKRVLVVNIVFLSAIVWLLNTCQSATSGTCLALACLVILAVRSKVTRNRPQIIMLTIPCIFLIAILLAFGLGLKGDFSKALGRDATMSGRTEIWEIVLGQQTSPFLGTGYESFWMGPRLDRIWTSGEGRLNEAHNGYLEAYLNLGYCGLLLLLLFVVVVYRNIMRKLRVYPDLACLGVAIWIAFVFHNCTEVDFRSGLMWLTFVLVALATSTSRNKRVAGTAVLANSESTAGFPMPVLSAAGAPSAGGRNS
ncbi:MAG TPA: O-antigen ligase family protein [Bryobacteraceae bacterium]|nr:O-antigen ligase family protein [Bryobacteraceae bacterium]